MNKKKLIVGLAAHYTFDMLWPFLSTLRATGYAGDIVFFYANLSEYTVRKLHEWGVTLVSFSFSYPYLPETLVQHNQWLDEPALHNLNIYCVRYLLVHSYLAEHAGEYDQVLFTDTRDVIFQKDPFLFDTRGALSFFLEREGLTIGKSSINAQWVVDGFGPEELERLKDKPIVCGGVILGSAEQIAQYAQRLLDTIIEKGVPTTIRGIDQSLCFYLAYEHQLSCPLELYPNTSGPVLTLGLEDHALRLGGYIYNQSGIVPYIVHQYDRHWYLAKHYYTLHYRWHLRLRHWRGILATKLKNRTPALYRGLHKLRDSLL